MVAIVRLRHENVKILLAHGITPRGNERWHNFLGIKWRYRRAYEEGHQAVPQTISEHTLAQSEVVQTRIASIEG